MEHWTRVGEPTDNPGIEAAERFAKHFIVEDADGSIYRDELYKAYLSTARESRPEAGGRGRA